MEYSVSIFSFLNQKNRPIREKTVYFEKKFGHIGTLDSEFYSLVAFFKLVLKLFRQVLNTYCQLMLNPAWDDETIGKWKKNDHLLEPEI